MHILCMDLSKDQHYVAYIFEYDYPSKQPNYWLEQWCSINMFSFLCLSGHNICEQKLQRPGRQSRRTMPRSWTCCATAKKFNILLACEFYYEQVVINGGVHWMTLMYKSTPKQLLACWLARNSSQQNFAAISSLTRIWHAAYFYVNFIWISVPFARSERIVNAEQTSFEIYRQNKRSRHLSESHFAVFSLG